MNKPQSSQQGLVWCGPVFDPSGYADEGRGMLCALEQVGVPVTLRALRRHVPGFREGLSPRELQTLDRQAARALPSRQILVQHHTADGFFHMDGDAYHVGRTMFETDAIPFSWVRHCNQMDELWLPSQFNIDTFRRAGVHVPITCVPGGIDSTVFHPDVPPMEVAGLRGTVFLSVFEWRRGKGWDVLLQAWADAFRPDDDVTLVLRTYPMGKVANMDNEAVINARIDAFLSERCGRARSDVAPIVVLGKTVPGSAMPSLYRMATALVAPTRGEGWGRPFMEAMASGVPVIATRWSAHLEFMNDDNSWLLDIDGLSPADGTEVPTYREQQWAEPSVMHLRSLLQRVHSERDVVETLGARARADMVSLWPWSRAALVMARRLDEIRESAAWQGAAVGQPLAAPSSVAPRLVVDAGLFNAHTGESAADRLVGEVVAQWPHPAVVHTRVASPQRPTLSSVGMHAWHALPGERTAPGRGGTTHDMPRTHSDDVVLTWLDASSVHQVARPTCARWTVHTGDMVVDQVPPPLVRLLRDEADDIWVPTSQALEACARIGVAGDRLWLIPSAKVPAHITPHGPRHPLPQRADAVFLLPAIDAAQAPAVDRIIRCWQRAFDAQQSALLVIYAPETSEAVVNAWHQQLLALLSSGRLLQGAPILVFRDRLQADELPALVRAADVLLDPSPTPRTIPIVHLAWAVGRAVISGDSDCRSVLRAHAAPDERARRVAESRAQSHALAGEEKIAMEACARLTFRAGRGETRHESIVAHDTAPFRVYEARSTTILAHVDWHDGTGSGVLQSYLLAFSSDDDVSLVLCLDPAQGFSVDQVASLVREAAHAAAVDEQSTADIVLVPDVITDEVRRALIARCDAVVAVHDVVLAEAARRSARRVITTLARGAWRDAGRLIASPAP